MFLHKLFWEKEEILPSHFVLFFFSPTFIMQLSESSEEMRTVTGHFPEEMHLSKISVSFVMTGTGIETFIGFLQARIPQSPIILILTALQMQPSSKFSLERACVVP